MTGTGIVPALLVALLLGWALARASRTASAGTLWTVGWVIIYLGGLLELIEVPPTAELLMHLGGPLFSALILAGTLVLYAVPLPRWLLPLAVGVGLGRIVLITTGLRTWAYLGALPLEAAAELGAVWVAWSKRPPSPRPLSETLLPFAFLLLTVVDATYLTFEFLDLDRWPGLIMWVYATIVTVVVQASVVFGRQLDRETELRREVEQHARRLAAEHRTVLALLEATPAGILLVDPQGRVSLMNQGAVRQLGVAAGDWQGRPAADVLGEWSRGLAEPASLAETLATIERDPRVTIGGLDLQTAGNGARQLELFTAPVLSEAEERLGRIWVLRDITDQKSLEQQVLQAQKFESLGLLAGGVAHDFNNLLAVILGNAELLSVTLSATSPEGKKLVDILHAARRAADLCLQMLAYAGKGRFVIEPIDLGRVATEAGQLLRSSLPKKITLSFDLADHLPAIDGDATQLRQLIMNLVVNAAEAIGDRPGTIGISTGVVSRHEPTPPGRVPAEAADGPAVYLQVEDTGCGMDEETRARMFDPFFSTKFTGRGLGLASVLGIVRSHHGSLDVRSSPGDGTTFRILLPIRDGHYPAPERAVAASAPGRGAGTILLAEDEVDLRDVTRLFLEEVGFSVLTAADGLEAVALFRQHHDHIAAVLLDLTMPRLDGAETLRELRRTDPRTPIILTSGYTAEQLPLDADGEHPAAFIHKPYSFEDLGALLSRLIG